MSLRSISTAEVRGVVIETFSGHHFPDELTCLADRLPGFGQQCGEISHVRAATVGPRAAAQL